MDKIIVDESKANVNLDKLDSYFNRVLDKYFDADGKIIPKYFEETNCYNCGSKQILSEFTHHRFKHVRCKVCGMVYVSPRFKEDIVHSLYSEQDYAEFFKIKLVPTVDYRRNVLAVNKYKQFIAVTGKKPARVLDVGSGLGEMLSVFSENGWETTGIEFNEFAANFSKERFNLNIIQESIFKYEPDQKYDVIMLWGVLEHFTNPQSVLKKVHTFLNDGGVLLLEVPSADSLLVRHAERMELEVDRIIEGDRHIMLFSLRGLLEMTAENGFGSLSLFSNGLDISTLNRLKFKNKLGLKEVNMLQAVLDESFQGDLLRGYFRKK